MTWVWLRGLARESGHWGGLPRLAELAMDEQVITLDLPGVGTKCQRDCPLNIHDIVAELTEETANLTEIRLMGVSLGGLIALHWAAHDQRIKQLVLINASSRLNFLYHRLKLNSAWHLLTAFTSNRCVEEQEQRVLEVVSNEPVRARQIVSLWAEIARRRPVTLRLVFRQLLLASFAGLPKRRDLKHCQIKVIASRSDRLVAPVCSKKLADYFDSPLVSHPSAGHDLPLDDPEWLLQQIATPIIEGEISQANC